MLCSLSSSHPHSPLNNHSYHSTSIIQSHPTSPISPASPTPSTQHQHDTSTHFLHHLFSLNEIDPALCHHYFPLPFILTTHIKILLTIMIEKLILITMIMLKILTIINIFHNCMLICIYCSCFCITSPCAFYFHFYLPFPLNKIR